RTSRRSASSAEGPWRSAGRRGDNPVSSSSRPRASPGTGGGIRRAENLDFADTSAARKSIPRWPDNPEARECHRKPPCWCTRARASGMPPALRRKPSRPRQATMPVSCLFLAFRGRRFLRRLRRRRGLLLELIVGNRLDIAEGDAGLGAELLVKAIVGAVDRVGLGLFR